MANDPTEKEKAAAAQAQAQSASQPTPPATTPAPSAPAATSGSDKPINSDTKSPEEASLEAAAAVPGSPAAAEVASRGVELDHGEPDERVAADLEAQKKAATDPWGTTPTQMRDVHDAAVDPAKVGVATRPDGSGLVAPSGIEPSTAGDDAPEGTLPPV